MTAIQLDLFTGVPMAPTVFIQKKATFPATEADGEVCPRQTISSTMTLDPCPSCPLHDLCSSDDCGMKLYDIDQCEPPYMAMQDWVQGVDSIVFFE